MNKEIFNPMERYLFHEETYLYGDGGACDCCGDCDDCCDNETTGLHFDGI